MAGQLSKSASTAIASGATSVTVTGLGLAFTPTGGHPAVRKPSAASDNLTAWIIGTPTSDGFTVELSSATPSTGYYLDWILWAESAAIDNSGTLLLTYDDIFTEVRHFLGYNATPTAGQTAEIDRYIQAGIRQFYYPPAAQGVEAGYEWSFLRPTTTLDTVEDDGVQDMPTDFARLAGEFHFEQDICESPIVQVSEARIQTLLQSTTDSGRPRYVALRFKQTFGLHGQLQECVWWPVPDDAYTLTYRYEAYTGKLTSDTNPCPLGGARHGELIVESCLAIAEQRANDERGLHTQRFYEALAAGIAMDRKQGSRHFGHMGGAGYIDEGLARARGQFHASMEVTYKGSVV